MSRLGKKPVAVPSGVKVSIAGSNVSVEGPKGKLDLEVRDAITVKEEGGHLICDREGNERSARALHGLYRSLLSNMVEGVTKGFEKKLQIVGVGYTATLEGTHLALNVGYCNTVKVPVPEDVTVNLPDATHIVVSGPNKQSVGQFAANVRKVRKPEPYKGTGIRYEDEQVRRKAGKAFGSGG
ncbi:50S ribosomal protein L6 [Planctomycetes bacterium Pan216]|uniref:Large ribosomal subunit protein uL6 n=1 Tax=Kolteria novifilia TaxID=2527975 RepID=A0A518AZN1_9BACT|nr:50S ribosomal protein L6 [Planctomycetes bacterium Pan216]